MKKIISFLAVCLLLAAMTIGASANTDVSAMIQQLPTVETFQILDADAQLEAYNQVQSAYDAYMALTEEERFAMDGAEETFEALFAHFNSLVMPVEQEMEVTAVQEPENVSVLPGVATLALVALVLWFFKKKV